MFSRIEWFLFSVTILAVFSFQTCSTAEKKSVNSSDQTTNKNMPANSDKNSASSDVNALAQKIELPVKPLEAVWLEEKLGNPDNNVPGPTDYRLTAVLKFSETDAEKLPEKINSEKLPGGLVEIEKWFPEDLKNKAGESMKLNGTKYDADAFLRSPYTQGTITRIENSNDFVLRLLSF